MMRRRRQGPGRPSGWRRRLEGAAPVRAMEWSRSERAVRAAARPRPLPYLALAVLEVALLTWLAAGPVLAIREVRVTGVHRLTAAEVRQAAGLDHPGSILMLDAASIRHGLAALVWVRDSSVSASLPGRVEIQVQEWSPLAGYRVNGKGDVYLLSAQAVVLTRGASAPGLLEVDGPPGPPPAVGGRAMDAQLLTVMVNIAQAFPGITGQEVHSFHVDACGDLTLVAGKGFRVIFGRVLTPEQYAALDAKLSALASIRGEVDYSSADLDYVNVENPSAPAVHLHSTPEPTPSPSPSPSPGATPSPAVTPSPSIQPVNPCP